MHPAYGAESPIASQRFSALSKSDETHDANAIDVNATMVGHLNI
jgi:hypothetical protein